MPKQSTQGQSTAKNILKIVLLVLAVIIVIAGIFVAVYFGTNGFGGAYPTFAVQVNGKPVLKSGNVELPDGSEIGITSLNDYTLKVETARPEEDFALNIDGKATLYSDLAGTDVTNGFTFTDNDGIIAINYGNLDEVLSSALDAAVEILSASAQDKFNLIITSGNSSVILTFELSKGIYLYPEHIVI